MSAEPRAEDTAFEDAAAALIKRKRADGAQWHEHGTVSVQVSSILSFEDGRSAESLALFARPAEYALTSNAHAFVFMCVRDHVFARHTNPQHHGCDIVHIGAVTPILRAGLERCVTAVMVRYVSTVKPPMSRDADVSALVPRGMSHRLRDASSLVPFYAWAGGVMRVLRVGHDPEQAWPKGVSDAPSLASLCETYLAHRSRAVPITDDFEKSVCFSRKTV